MHFTNLFLNGIRITHIEGKKLSLSFALWLKIILIISYGVLLVLLLHKNGAILVFLTFSVITTFSSFCPSLKNIEDSLLRSPSELILSGRIHCFHKLHLSIYRLPKTIVSQMIAGYSYWSQTVLGLCCVGLHLVRIPRARIWNIWLR